MAALTVSLPGANVSRRIVIPGILPKAGWVLVQIEPVCLKFWRGISLKSDPKWRCRRYPCTDSNCALRLRRPTLCPLSYGGERNGFYHIALCRCERPLRQAQDKLREGLALTKPTGITLTAAFFIHHGGFTAFGA